jgi:hypothetical protein
MHLPCSSFLPGSPMLQITEHDREVSRPLAASLSAASGASALPFAQAGLFANDELLWDEAESASVDLLSSVRFPWYADDEIHSSALPQQPGLFGSTSVKIDRFHSGSSAYWDFRGYMLAGVPIGITATALPKRHPERVVDLVASYTAQGGLVFCDSGAFGAFCAGRSLDFASEVFPVYDRILSACTAPQNLRFVMPDVVGDPAASMALQHAHADRIRAWMDANVVCIFPLHSPSDTRFLSAIKTLADGRAFTIGVPSNLEAWSLSELLSFCARHQPASIHMLGLGQAQRVQAVGDEVARVSPLTSISCDSCTLIAHAGQGRRLTDRCRTRLADAIEWVMDDPCADVPFPDLSTYLADLLYTPNYLSEADVLMVAKHLDVDEQSLVMAGQTEGLAAVLSALDPDEQWLHEKLGTFVRDHLYQPKLERTLRGPIRAWEVARLAGMPEEDEPASLDKTELPVLS